MKREVHHFTHLLGMLCALVILSSCTGKDDTVTGSENISESMKYDRLGEYNIVEVDSTHIEQVTQKFNRLLNEIPFKANKSALSSKYVDKVSPLYIDTTFGVNVFESKRAYEAVLSAVSMEYAISGKSIPVAKDNRSLIEAHILTPEDGYFLNHQQKIVIGDTLYHFNNKAETVKKTDLLTDTSEDASLNDMLPDPPGGGGGGGSVSGPCDGYNDPIGLFTLGRFIVDEVVTDAFGSEWDVRLTYGNAAYTDSYFIRRSRTITTFSFKVHGSDQFHYYQGEPRLWYYPPDLPPQASSRFPNSHVDANMRYKSKKGLQLTCRTRNRGDSGEFTADRIKGRCANTGVVSWHNAVLGGQTFLNNVCVE